MGWKDTCAAADCERIVGRKGARGYCPKHYRRLRVHGSPHGGHANRFYTQGISLAERVESKIVKHPNGGCWEWTAGCDPMGYAKINNTEGGSCLVHVWSYEHFVGPIPDGHEIDHTCHDPSVCAPGTSCPHRRCCNPDHLEAVTHKVNTLRGGSFAAVNARKTHCPRGHPYDETNTRWYDGRRYCRACARARRALGSLAF